MVIISMRIPKNQIIILVVYLAADIRWHLK